MHKSTSIHTYILTYIGVDIHSCLLCSDVFNYFAQRSSSKDAILIYKIFSIPPTRLSVLFDNIVFFIFDSFFLSQFPFRFQLLVTPDSITPLNLTCASLGKNIRFVGMQTKMEGERERRIANYTISRLDIDSREHERECECFKSKGKWRWWMVGNKIRIISWLFDMGFLCGHRTVVSNTLVFLKRYCRTTIASETEIIILI